MEALTVIHPFATYQTGDQITDPETMRQILEGDSAMRVVRVNIPDKP